MAGCFGLKEDHHHVRVPIERLTDARPCLDCFRLAQEGLLFAGASATVQTRSKGYRIAARNGGILINGTFVAMRSHPFNGRNFVCPKCGRDCYQIYEVDGWACRKCHRLDYASRHRNRMIPGFNRLLYLRRSIGEVELPFAPIQPRPLSARKFWWVVREIRRIESGLVNHARTDVREALERRHKRKPGG